MKSLKNKSLMIYILGLTGATAISCMPPVYYTAEVEPQTSFTAGGGYIGYGYYYPSGLDGPWDDFREARGGRVDFTYRYAGDPKHYIQSESFAKLWQKLAIVIEGGILVTDGGSGFLLPWDSTRILPLGEIGLQYEFCERPSLSAQVGIVYPYPSVTLLAGIPYWPGRREIITIGIKTLMWEPHSAFVTVHPSRSVHITVQTNPMAFISGEEWELQALLGIDLVNTSRMKK